MKNGGACSKCNGTAVLRIPGTIGAFGAGNNIPVGWRALNAIAVTRFVCGSCGYCEEWIPDADDLDRLRKRFGPGAARATDAAARAPSRRKSLKRRRE